jgi:hypothetical protein
MKKSTGIVFLVVLALAAVAYFYDWKRNPYKAEPANGITLPFTVKEEDVTQITLTRQGATVVLDRKEDGWYISKPIATRANQSAVNNIAHYIAIVPQDRTVPSDSEQQNSYGLTNPAQILEFKTRNGETHKLRMGAGDFSGLEVYAQVDDSEEIVLLSNVLFKSSDKSLEELRDRTVLAITPEQIASFELHNPSGDISAERSNSSWKLLKPRPAPGDQYSIRSLLGALSSTQITAFVNDDPKDPAPAVLKEYGLTDPVIRFHAKMDDNKSVELLLGKKQGAEQYAMKAAPSSIFRVPATLERQLSQTFQDLRAKVLFAGSQVFLDRVEIRNQYGVITCVKDDRSGGMVIEQSPSQKNMPTSCMAFLDPLERTPARRLSDQPSAAIKAMFDKPDVQITLIQRTSGSSNGEGDQANNKTEIQISAPSGNSVYGQSSAGPTVYEFERKAFEALTSKPAATLPATTTNR